MAILEAVLITSALLLNTKGSKKKRKPRVLTAMERQRKMERENRRLYQEALKSVAKALND